MIDKGVLRSVADENFRGVCEIALDVMNRAPIPGAVVGVLHGGQEFIAGFGQTSVEHALPVSAETLFQIGSITKTYAATAVMRLVEQGKLKLDAPVRTYLPGLKLADESVAARVTLRHLLTHTGGWVGDYFNDVGPSDDALARVVAQLASLPQLTPLGEIWSYNNAGFYIVGRMIEVVTGQSFETALRGLVLDPLGLTRSFFFAHDVITHSFAVGHQVINHQPRVARPWAVGRALHPVGGLVCSMGDLFRYARFHMGDGTAPDGTRLLSVASLAEMQTPLLPASGLNQIGLAWQITTVEGTRLVGHGGGTHGQNTLFRMVPARHFAVAVFTNSDDGDALCNDFMAAAIRIYMGLTLPEAQPLDLPEATLKPYVGDYDAAEDHLALILQDGGLLLQQTYKGGFPTPDVPPPPPPPAMRAALYAEDRLVVLDEPLKNARGEFLRDPEGQIVWLRLGGRVHARQG